MDIKKYRGRIKFIKDEGWGFIKTEHSSLKDVFFSKNNQVINNQELKKNDTVEFNIQKEERGLKAINIEVIERNIVKHHTEDKFAWCREGEKLEEAFVREIVPKLNKRLVIHPNKKQDPTSIDLYNPETEEISDLKSQKTPFFTSFLYGYDASFTVTFNKKDYLRYKEIYPNAIIYWYVKWEQTAWKDIEVDPLEGVWEVPFSFMAKIIEEGDAPLHQYKNRINDDTNAKESYLFDLRNFSRLL